MSENKICGQTCGCISADQCQFTTSKWSESKEIVRIKGGTNDIGFSQEGQKITEWPKDSDYQVYTDEKPVHPTIDGIIDIMSLVNKSLHDASRLPFSHPSEPKADPKEKELYSIKPLVWRESFDEQIAETSIGTYCIANRGRYWECYVEHTNEVVNENCLSEDEAKRQAQDHLNSKLKLCLNREL